MRCGIDTTRCEIDTTSLPGMMRHNLLSLTLHLFLTIDNCIYLMKSNRFKTSDNASDSCHLK